jgi:hypothetical protein
MSLGYGYVFQSMLCDEKALRRICDCNWVAMLGSAVFLPCFCLFSVFSVSPW